MFGSLSHLALQQYWWIIVSLLGSIFVFMTFVQGGQTLLGQISKNDTERSMLVNAIGRKWDLTFTTIVTFGGAFFASFPLFYSTSFGGAYWIWTLILFSFIIQAVSYEYRTKTNNWLGRKTFDTFLFINGVLATVLVGAAVGTFFTGSEFSVDKMRITATSGSRIISQWETLSYGLEAALNVMNLSLGLTLFFLARILGAMFFITSINHTKIQERSVKQIKINTIPFLVFFLLFVVLLLTKQGYAVNPDTKVVSMENFKYLTNLLQLPAVAVILLLGVVGVVVGIFVSAFKGSRKGFWISGAGTVLTVLAVFFLAGFNNTAYYPSNFDLQSSLTLENSSSSHYTLTVMSYVSLLVPFVIAYIAYTWKTMTRKKIDEADLLNDEMKY